ncbi:MAG: UDP-2,3-diacylglucosamine diphosphatase, partial [Chromatiales bacterium]|nr:UDP-2,3-diacylglucosamine diphosphatase [Chromatiales bacterium]
TDAFTQFLDTLPSATRGLYILGDLFDGWLGDDDARRPHGEVTGAIARAAGRGIAVHVMHGNHDFLLGERFATASGSQSLPDPYVTEFFGVRTVLSHGDALCTDDTEYQQWRAYSRDAANQAAFLSLPMEQRAAQAAALRHRSQAAVQLKAADIMDVNDAAVAQLLDESRADVLIHGHTHRPACHRLSLPSRPATRWVLGDWYGGEGKSKQGHTLIWSADSQPHFLGR